jgi:hypothetical protein
MPALTDRVWISSGLTDTGLVRHMTEPSGSTLGMKDGNITEDTGSATIAGRIGIETVTGIITGNNTEIMTGIATKGRTATGKGTATRIKTGIATRIGIATGIIAGMVRTDGGTGISWTDSLVHARKLIDQVTRPPGNRTLSRDPERPCGLESQILRLLSIDG